MDFLIGVDFAPYTVGTAALLFIPGRLRRTLLVLAAAPMTLFFCGYPVVMNCGLRWILAVLPFLFFAPFACGFFRKEDCKTAWLLAVPLLFAVLFTAPCAPDGMKSILPWGLHTMAHGAETVRYLTVFAGLLTAASLVFLAKKRRPFFFLLVFAGLFFSGMPILTGAALLLALLRALYDAFFLVRRFISAK